MRMQEHENDAPSWLGGAAILTIAVGLALQAAGAWGWLSTWLSSANAASWVQAFGAVLAIMASTWIVGRQIRDARRLAAQTVLRDRQYRQLVAWESFFALASRASVECGTINLQLGSREAIYNVAASDQIDFGPLDVIERWLDRIDPIETPSTLVSNALDLAIGVKRFRKLVEQCLTEHRRMDADQFDDWFRKARMEVTSALQVVQRAFSDLQVLKRLHGINLGALAVDADEN